MRKLSILAAAAASMLAVQPALAGDFRDAGAAEQRSGAFAGLSLRVPLGSEKAAKPSARLQLTMQHETRTMDEVRGYRPAGLELGLSGTGNPDLYFGGMRVADTEKKLGLSGMPDWILPAALLTGVVVAVVLLTDGDNELPAN